MVEIIPALLATDKESFLNDLNRIENFADFIHIDISDGIFTTNKLWADPEILKTILKINCEIHLMVTDPVLEAKKWKNVPQAKRIIIHYESGNPNDTLPAILSLEREVTIALNPETSVDVLEPCLPLISGVMFMGVHPGKQGQTFIPETVARISEFKKKRTWHRVSADGGIDSTNINSLISAGVDAVCVGSAIFRNEKSPKENINHLRTIMEVNC